MSDSCTGTDGPTATSSWDNRCTMHVALADYHARRRMHRVSVLGAGPIAAAN